MRHLHPASGFTRAFCLVQASCGGEGELALLLHCTHRTVQNYRHGHTRPSRLVCLQLARICRTLDGAESLRTAEYWQELAGIEVPA